MFELDNEDALEYVKRKSLELDDPPMDMHPSEEFKETMATLETSLKHLIGYFLSYISLSVDNEKLFPFIVRAPKLIIVF